MCRPARLKAPKVPAFLSGHLTVNRSLLCRQHAQSDRSGRWFAATAVQPLRGPGDLGESGILVFGGAGNPLRAVSASGGEPFQVTEWDPSQAEGGHLHPVFLPGGRRLLFRQRGSTTAPGGIYTASLDSKATELVIAVSGIHTPYSKIFVAAGRLLFVQEATLMAAPFDDRRVRVQGVPAPVAQTRGPFAVAGAGLLVYAEPVPAQLAWVDRHGQEVQTLPIMGAIGAPRLSHDGGRVAVTRMVEGAARRVTSGV